MTKTDVNSTTGPLPLLQADYCMTLLVIKNYENELFSQFVVNITKT